MRLHEALSFLRSHGILGPVSSCVGHVVLAIVTWCQESTGPARQEPWEDLCQKQAARSDNGEFSNSTP